MKILLYALVLITLICCKSEGKQDTQSIQEPQTTANEAPTLPAAELPDEYLPLLEGKKVGLVVNHTSMVGDLHILDFLISKKINVVRVFAPEHGFRGNADAGEEFNNAVDKKTNVEIFSLFGKNKKPTKESLKDIDVFVFDIQDVGVRFYTYISTMHYVMEVCAENNKPLIILDRPNPNGDYVDGPILRPEYKSFVGIHPIPVVHGLTVGELAKMIHGEKWLKNGLNCNLTVIKAKNYSHKMQWSLKVKPSPNLPNDLSVRLYPSLCFFEATDISIGRGTHFPFQVIGYPDSIFGEFKFTPKSIDGMSKNPKNKDLECFGVDLRNTVPNHQMTLSFLIDFHKKWNRKTDFFARKKWMSLLAGTDKLAKQIEQGLSESEIRASWQKELDEYKKMRKKYLLYEDF